MNSWLRLRRRRRSEKHAARFLTKLRATPQALPPLCDLDVSKALKSYCHLEVLEKESIRTMAANQAAGPLSGSCELALDFHSHPLFN
jgi:hypothetical protein